MRMRNVAVVAGLALGLMSGTAKAAYIISFEQVGRDVIATGSGRLNLNGSQFDQQSNVGYGNGVTPSASNIYLGLSSQNDVYSGISNPAPFGSGGGVAASSSAGDYIGIAAAIGEFFVPSGYVSGTTLLSTDTFSDQTFATLGLKTGSYTYSLASDKIVVDVGVSTVPLPASAPMFGAALMALGAVGYGVKRKKAAAAA